MKTMVRKISLEAYLDFLQCPDYSKLTMNSLNQIITMHGFSKVKAPKSVAIDAAECVDLIDPSRSTLNSSITPAAAFITIEDCVALLNALEWQECCVTSIHSFPVATEPKKPKRKRKRQPEILPHAEAGGNSSSALMSLASC